jgi:hypothetical protein
VCKGSAGSETESIKGKKNIEAESIEAKSLEVGNIQAENIEAETIEALLVERVREWVLHGKINYRRHR